jgi:inorganic pyrophosphatase
MFASRGFAIQGMAFAMVSVSITGGHMPTQHHQDLPAWDAASGNLNVVIETTKGSRTKLKYLPEEQIFALNKVLPRGTVFPFDFGFIPSTVADDGDPLDVLVLLAESVPAGCKISARLIGVIEMQQTAEGKPERNDRLIAVADCCDEHSHLQTLKDLDQYLIDEIEHFFVSYQELSNKQCKILGYHGPKRARKLVELGIKRDEKRQLITDRRVVAWKRRSSGPNRVGVSTPVRQRAINRYESFNRVAGNCFSFAAGCGGGRDSRLRSQ